MPMCPGTQFRCSWQRRPNLFGVRVHKSTTCELMLTLDRSCKAALLSVQICTTLPPPLPSDNPVRIILAHSNMANTSAWKTEVWPLNDRNLASPVIDSYTQRVASFSFISVPDVPPRGRSTVPLMIHSDLLLRLIRYFLSKTGHCGA